jgi:hypothetical protein
MCSGYVFPYDAPHILTLCWLQVFCHPYCYLLSLSQLTAISLSSCSHQLVTLTSLCFYHTRDARIPFLVLDHRHRTPCYICTCPHTILSCYAPSVHSEPLHSSQIRTSSYSNTTRSWLRPLSFKPQLVSPIVQAKIEHWWWDGKIITLILAAST